MKKILFILLAGLFILAAGGILFNAVSLAWAAEETPAVISSFNQLIEKASEFDGRLVAVTGEAIGDLMLRQNGSWLNISDGSTALGIFFNKNETSPPDLK